MADPVVDSGASSGADSGGWRLSRRATLLLPALALIGGIITGAVGGAFRWLLVRLGDWRDDMLSWAHDLGGWGFLMPLGIAAIAAAAAAAIAKRVPLAAGSGIQHVEAVERGEAEPPPLRVLPARFVGGLLSIGVAGMVLGREGPTVHMGAAAGAAVSRWARARADEVRTLQTVLAGAGLAVAFNAPIGGALFVFEEVSKKIRMSYVIATLVGVVAAISTSRLILGDHLDFTVPHVDTPGAETLPIFVVFGLVVGVLGVAYSRLTVLCLDGFDALQRIPVTVKAGMIGGAVGLLLFANPLTVGGGDALSQLIVAGERIALPMILLYTAIRFAAGPLSYAAGTPGGLFAPMLALGALMGVGFARAVEVFFPGLGVELAVPLAIVGMTALFAAVVRAPFTGIVLVMEMTATTAVTIPMAAASAMAVVVATMCASPPVYDTLRERMLAGWVDDGKPGRG